MGRVCVLAPDHAVALEERGVIPDCKYHGHFSHREADAAIDGQRDDKTGLMLEGWGRARSVRSIDGRRRITPIAQILGYVSRPSIWMQLFGSKARIGFFGPSTLQAVMSELH